MVVVECACEAGRVVVECDAGLVVEVTCDVVDVDVPGPTPVIHTTRTTTHAATNTTSGRNQRRAPEAITTRSYWLT
jgi:hypothetical protein